MREILHNQLSAGRESRHIIRPAVYADLAAIQAFLDSNLRIHRHLDWLSPAEWLGHQPYLILEKKGNIEALLICPAEARGVYWIRLFAVRSGRMMNGAFRQLFNFAREQFFQQEQPRPQVACIVNQTWLRGLVVRNGWRQIQQVVQLKWHPSLYIPSRALSLEGVVIRPMTRSDIRQVTAIDQASFAPLWQHSEQTINRALDLSVYATVCELEHQPIGYQLSTGQASHAHIARLAVLPAFQRRHLGLALVEDALRHFNQAWIREITVNTQADNFRSLNLYHQLGFRQTNDRFPIFSYFE